METSVKVSLAGFLLLLVVQVSTFIGNFSGLGYNMESLNASMSRVEESLTQKVDDLTVRMRESEIAIAALRALSDKK